MLMNAQDRRPLNVVGLTPMLIGPAMPRLARVGAVGRRWRAIEPAFPAVTCTAQSDYLTGHYPDTHGIVGNGWYSREDCEVRFWKQSNQLVQAPKIWETARAERSVVHLREPVLVVQHVFDGGLSASRRGRCIRPTAARCPTSTPRPAALRDELQAKLGTFPLFEFWGPRASIESTPLDRRRREARRDRSTRRR